MVMSGAILPFDAVCTGSPAIITLQKVNKQAEGKIRRFKVELRIKSCETRTYILYFNPYSCTELGIKYPLVYLQV